MERDIDYDDLIDYLRSMINVQRDLIYMVKEKRKKINRCVDNWVDDLISDRNNTMIYAIRLRNKLL